MIFNTSPLAFRIGGDADIALTVEVHRIRLAYGSCSDYSTVDGTKYPDVSPKITYTDANGQKQTWGGFKNPADPTSTGDIQLVHSYEDPYRE